MNDAPGQKDASIARATYSIDETAVLLGVGRNAAYAAAKAKEIPTIRIGRSLRVPKAALDRMLGIGSP
jgi:excisionase family DNA binding protein